MKMTKAKITSQAQAHLLAESRRRCALCFGLERDLRRKVGQIAHLNQNPSDDTPDNLVFLCMEHHDEYDSTTRISKGLTELEVRRYRDDLLKELERLWSSGGLEGDAPDTAPSPVINALNVQVGNLSKQGEKFSRVRGSRRTSLRLDSGLVPEFLHAEIMKRYGVDTGYLVVRYGSSAREPIDYASVSTSDEVGVPNDEDYLVLVYGNPYSHHTEAEEIGHSRRPTSRFAKAIDIQLRLYDSFLVGLTMGRPYEISVAADGQLFYAEGLPDTYWPWLKSLMTRLTYDSAYVAANLIADIELEKAAYARACDAGDRFGAVIAAYWICCDRIAAHILSVDFPKTVGWRPLYELAQPLQLREYLSNWMDGNAVSDFDHIVRLFKRNRIPRSEIEFGALVERLDGRLKGKGHGG